jgi:hypothetical protein
MAEGAAEGSGTRWRIYREPVKLDPGWTYLLRARWLVDGRAGDTAESRFTVVDCTAMETVARCCRMQV